MKIKSTLFIFFCFTAISVFGQTKNTSSEKQLTEAQEKVLIDNYKIKAKKDKVERKELDGTVVDDLSFTDIDGNKYTSQSLRGKVVVINFWFIQCKPCVKEFPDLNKLKSDFENQPVEFFAVSWNDKKSLEAFLKVKKLDYTVIPSGGKLTDKFKVPYYPYNMIIDKSGKVEYINEVLSLNVMSKIKRKVKRLL